MYELVGIRLTFLWNGLLMVIQRDSTVVTTTVPSAWLEVKLTVPTYNELVRVTPEGSYLLSLFATTFQQISTRQQLRTPGGSFTFCTRVSYYVTHR